jgi:hypothetical protein
LCRPSADVGLRPTITLKFPTMLAHRLELSTKVCIRLAYILLISCFPRYTMSQPATVPFNDCFTGNSTQKLDVTVVYAQVLNGPDSYLNLTILGASNESIQGYSNDSTLGTPQQYLVFILVSQIIPSRYIIHFSNHANFYYMDK